MGGCKMLIGLILLLLGSLQVKSQAQKNEQTDVTLSILSIGNAYYNNPGLFDSYADINYSAEKFLNCFKGLGTLCLMKSGEGKILSKQKMLDAIKNFIDFVETRDGKDNIGIIYYCGHGMANLAGSMYFVPGQSDIKLTDTTFEYLSDKLMNVDEINKLIINAQLKENSRSTYIILGDCCSNRINSKWYNGISYQFLGDSLGTVIYDSTALSNMNSINSSLRASANLQFDSAGNFVVPARDTTKTTIDEFNFIGELIRNNTVVKKNGNMIFYSSLTGKTTEMVNPPWTQKNGYKVGPICRRTLLYFKKYGKVVLSDYLNKLISVEFDRITTPVQLNRSRNNETGK